MEFRFSKKKKVYFLIGTIVLILTIPIFKYHQNHNSKEIVGNINKITDLQRTRQLIGETGFSIETPFEFVKENPEIIDSLNHRKRNKSKNVYYNLDIIISSQIKCSLSFSFVEFPNLKISETENLNKIKENILNGNKTENGVSNFTFTLDTIYKNNIKGYICLCSFDRNKVREIYHFVIFCKDKKMWFLSSNYDIEDKLAKELSTRIINSIEIK